MKNRKIFVMTLIVILYFSIMLQGLTFSNGKDDKDNIAGLKTSFGGEGMDMVLVKYDSSGVQQWDRTWGRNNEEAMGVAVDSSDNVYLAGYSYITYGVDGDMVLVKYDSSGVQLWDRTWGGIAGDGGVGLAVDSSANVYVVGLTNSFGAGDLDLVLVKYDSSGVQQWNRTWGGSNEERGWGVAVDSSDNVYVSGWTYSFGAGNMDMVLVKYDSSGVQQWNRTWGGSNEDGGLGVAVDSSDNVYLAGRAQSFGVGSSDMVLVKYDSSGVQQWNRTWGGINNDRSWGVAVDSSDNAYLTGRTYSFGAGDSDLVLVKYDSSGVQQWNHTWGGSSLDRGTAVAFDSSDNVYASGYTDSFGAGSEDMVLVKFDSSGVQQWNHTWGVSDDDDDCYGVAVDLSDNVYLSGSTSEREEEPPAISGYDLLLFISLIGVITAIAAVSLKKKYHK